MGKTLLILEPSVCLRMLGSSWNDTGKLSIVAQDELLPRDCWPIETEQKATAQATSLSQICVYLTLLSCRWLPNPDETLVDVD